MLSSVGAVSFHFIVSKSFIEQLFFTCRITCRWIYSLGDKSYIDATDVGMVGYVHRMDYIPRNLSQLISSPSDLVRAEWIFPGACADGGWPNSISESRIKAIRQ